MHPSATRHCSFSARLDCHYLLHVPDTVTPRTLLIVTLHGFSSNPETMLRLTTTMFGEQHAIASIQGPNQFYTSIGSDDVGFGWITGRNAASGIRLHHDMVLYVLDQAGREYGIPPERRILCGFSQPVSLNYRLAATHPRAVRGVAGICGGIPSDWDDGNYKPVEAAILHIARRADEIYPAAVTERYPERLHRRAEDVEFHMIDGGHRFPSKARHFADGWLGRILR